MMCSTVKRLTVFVLNHFFTLVTIFRTSFTFLIQLRHIHKHQTSFIIISQKSQFSLQQSSPVISQKNPSSLKCLHLSSIVLLQKTTTSLFVRFGFRYQFGTFFANQTKSAIKLRFSAQITSVVKYAHYAINPSMSTGI